MTDRENLADSIDHQVREYGRRLRRPDSPRITEEDLLERGFIHAGGKGALLSRFAGRLRLDALPDLQGNYTCLELCWDDFARVRLRFASLAEWDIWLTTFNRENPR